MQSKNKNVRNELPTRYRRYCEFKRHLRERSGGEVFPIGGADKKSIEQVNSPVHSNDRIYSDKGLSPTINTAQGGNRQPFIKRGRPYYDNGKRKLNFKEYDICPTVSTMCSTGDQKNIVVQPVLTPDRANKRQNGRRFKEDGEPSFTLTGQDKHGIYDGTKIRRLTPRECERLQGLPDDWTIEGTEGAISDSQRYKMCGNAVTVNVIKEITKKLI